MSPPESRQRGVVLLLMLLGVFVAGTTMFLGVMNNRQALSQQRLLNIMQEMKEAKAALIAYAASTDNNTKGTGLLPCPDVNNDGLPDYNCDPTTAWLGRLPRYTELTTLNLTGQAERYYFNADIADTGQQGAIAADIDQQLWLAVSPDYIHTSDGSSIANQANSNIPGALTLDGATDIVAVLIAPGEAFDGQDRATNPTAYSQYLEGGNGASYIFTSSFPANPSTFNDVVLPITRQEIMDVATTIAATRIKDAMDSYRNTCGHYPRYSIFVCGVFSFSHPAEAVAFRNAMNNTSAIPVWAKSSDGLSAARQNWVTITTYDYISTSSATIIFAGCPNVMFNLAFTNDPDDVGIEKMPVDPNFPPKC